MICANGCISSQYRYGLAREGAIQPVSADHTAVPVTYGEPRPRLERIEKWVQTPREAFRKLRGQTPETLETRLAAREAALAVSQEYLHVNQLTDLYIDVRVYDPPEQWRRLQMNQEIRPVFRYTAGTLSWLRYSLLPGTVFRSDRYDPFTKTLSLNSDDAARAIWESAQAKQFARDRWLGPGAYATMQYLPFATLVHNTQVANDVLTYSQHHLQGQLLDQLYPLAGAQIGSTVVSETLSVFSLPPGTSFIARPVLQGTGVLTGRAVGTRLSQEYQPPLTGSGR